MPINEVSLNNLRKEKVKKEGYGHRYSIPQTKIDELFAYLADGMTLTKAAKEANICLETARKYYHQGDIKRGVKPLHFRLTVFQDKIHEKFNVLVEERRMKLLETVRKAIENFEEKISKGSMLEKATIRDLDRLIRLEMFLLGGVTQKEKSTKMLTAEEISG